MTDKIQQQSSQSPESSIDKALALIPSIEFDSSGGVADANEAMLEALDYTESEISALSLEGIVSLDEPDQLWAAGESTPEPAELRTKSGDSISIFAICTRRGRGKNATRTLVAMPASDDRAEAAETASADAAWVEAISLSQAVIEFDLTGHILRANENFLAAAGYSLDEIVGKHHRIFCTDEYAASEDYKEFWRTLNRGQFFAGEVERKNKTGDTLWLQASYNPIMDSNGQVQSIVKFASDITESIDAKQRTDGMVKAISKSQAVIQFDLDGIITDANENFCGATGYRLDEIVGQHHRIFCDPSYASSPEYVAFWEALNRGEFAEGEFERRTKSGEALWIQATYNPIFDRAGKPTSVVKFAADITADVEDRAARAQKQQEQNDWLNAEVDKLLNVVSSAGRGELDARVVSDAEGPVGELGVGVNKMLSDLEAMVEADRARSEALSAEVNAILGVVSKAAKGDLTCSVESSAEGPVGELASGVNSMIGELREIVGHVITDTGQVTDQATTIDQEVAAMARRTEQLGATTEEMSANVEELTASISSIAKNGRDADKLAKAASTDAKDGTLAVKESMEAMETINGSANEIGEIVKVISEIASQTNLLAFNAAIEAARAGQHGRGFAVVADEVRKLAERSSDATKEISKLIQESTSRIAKGAKVSENASHAFRQIADRVEQTYAAINQIATGAEEQATAASDVNSGIQSVSEDAEQSAHSCEQIAQTCRLLSEQSKGLQDLVSRFTV